ncbi:MAG TPA: hypothetical protein ENJ43_04300 [Gammaproteobacteria bacterium]|nr:hypothetical protein [Gammaproteobacteria bacterium]
MKRRKPDILIILAVATGLGVLVTGYAHNLFPADPANDVLQQISDNARKAGSGDHELAARRDGFSRHEKGSL